MSDNFFRNRVYPVYFPQCPVQPTTGPFNTLTPVPVQPVAIFPSNAGHAHLQPGVSGSQYHHFPGHPQGSYCPPEARQETNLGMVASQSGGSIPWTEEQRRRAGMYDDQMPSTSKGIRHPRVEYLQGRRNIPKPGWNPVSSPYPNGEILDNLLRDLTIKEPGPRTYPQK